MSKARRKAACRKNCFAHGFRDCSLQSMVRQNNIVVEDLVEGLFVSWWTGNRERDTGMGLE